MGGDTVVLFIFYLPIFREITISQNFIVFKVMDVIKELEEEEQFPSIKVNLMNDNLSKVFANSKRAEQDFREFPNVLRQAISLARRMQDPLIEFTQLCGPENEILALRYHPLQDLLSEEELLEGLNLEFINRYYAADLPRKNNTFFVTKNSSNGTKF